jgi:predicted  nucleic acid-binding Zn-ribbon protein
MTTEWDEVLDRLLSLQSLDAKLRRLDQQLTRMPAEVEQREKSVGEIDAKIKKIEDRLKLLKAQMFLRENELKGNDKKIERLKEQASEVRTNKEFVAFRSEISNVQGESDRLQNEILKIMDVVEQADAKLAEYAEVRQRETDRVEKVKADMAARLENVRLDREALATTRPEAMKDIPKEHMDLYEKARMARGYGMSNLEGAYCGGCGEMQTRNDVYAVQNRTRIVLCRGCNRILYQV